LRKLEQGVIWGGWAIASVFVFIRIFARFRAFKRLYLDDAFVIFALAPTLASAIVWQIFAKSSYRMMAVVSGQAPPGPTFIADGETFSKTSLSAIFCFYSALWSIKLSFLLFFKRLVKNVRRQERLWWPIFGVTMATYFACIGTIPYGCLTGSFETIMATCAKESTLNHQRIAHKLGCACDVITDFLSLPPFPF
jgi:hypothetical protein